MKRTFKLLLLTATVAVPASAFAQTGESGLEKRDNMIVVTARKSEENIQDVPISVKAFDQEEITRKGISNIDDIAKLTAGLIFDSGGIAPQDLRVVIRGLSPSNGRQNVAILQDSIDVSSESLLTAGGSLLMNSRLFDVERVEVVKGPQMALFGRSAFAGAINYISKRPGNEFEGRVKVDAGGHGQFDIGVGASGPIVEDVLSVGVNASHWVHDGFYRNSVTGGRLGGQTGYGISATALLKAADNLSFFARVEYTDDEFEPRARAILPANTLLPVPASAAPVTSETVVPDFTGSYGNAAGLVPTISENPRTGIDYDGVDRQIFRATLTGEWESDQISVTSLTHYADAAVRQFEDAQIVGSFSTIKTPFRWGIGSEFLLDSSTKLFSQELRVASNGGGAINWMIGGLYWNEDVTLLDGSMNVINTIGSGAAALLPVGNTVPRNMRYNNRKTRHWSAFGLVGWEITPAVTITAEGRYVTENLEIIGSSVGAISFLPAFGGFPYPAGLGVDVFGQDKDNFFAPKGTIEWKPADDKLLYFSVAQSIKPSGISSISGGADGFSVETNRFDQEKMITYEVGAKTGWFDNRLVFNAAAFLQDFRDKQSTSVVILANGLPGVKPVNASSAEVWGVELDASWTPVDSLLFTASYAWLDARYKDFKRITTGGGSIASAGNCTVVMLGGRPACEVDLSGNTLENVPKHSFNVSARYTQSLTSEINLFVEIDGRYQSRRFDSSSNSRWFDSHWLSDMQLGFQGANWDLVGYVKNLFDDDTIRVGTTTTDLQTFRPPATIYNVGKAALPDRRTFGVRANFRF